MTSQNIKYLAREKGSRLVASIAARPAIIEPTDVMIRVKTVAINPADCKMIDEGHRGATWPLVPGLDGAGVVEAIGDSVKKISVGDKVVALFTTGDRAASYQELAVVQESAVAKVPAEWSLEDAATLGFVIIPHHMSVKANELSCVQSLLLYFCGRPGPRSKGTIAVLEGWSDSWL